MKSHTHAGEKRAIKTTDKKDLLIIDDADFGRQCRLNLGRCQSNEVIHQRGFCRPGWSLPTLQYFFYLQLIHFHILLDCLMVVVGGLAKYVPGKAAVFDRPVYTLNANGALVKRFRSEKNLYFQKSCIWKHRIVQDSASCNNEILAEIFSRIFTITVTDITLQPWRNWPGYRFYTYKTRLNIINTISSRTSSDISRNSRVPSNRSWETISK